MASAKLRSKWRIVLSLALGGALASAAGAQEKVIKIGTLYPLTGPCAVAGERCKAAVETMAEVLNNPHPEIHIPLADDKGFLKGYRFVLVNADTQGRPEVAKSEAERLYNQEGVYCVLGSYNSSCSKPASAVGERLGKLFLCGSSSSATLTERGFRHFFRFAATDRTEAREYVDYLKQLNREHSGAIRTVGLIYENTEFGKHAGDEAKAACRAAGLAVVADVLFAPGATNLNSEVQTLKARRPDAVFGACLGGDYTLWVRTMKQLNVAPKVVMDFCTGYQDPIIARQLGADGDYFMGGCQYSPEIGRKYMKSVAPLTAIYRARTGVEFDSDSIEEAVALHILAQAIARARTLDTDRVAQTIRSNVWDSPLSLGGKVAFDASGQNIRAMDIITQLKTLNYVNVFPESFAESKVVFPMPAWSGR
jgi:branched-chain amino acid transport system substrate-binding protein